MMSSLRQIEYDHASSLSVENSCSKSQLMNFVSVTFTSQEMFTVQLTA